jgi:hypothetical protein
MKVHSVRRPIGRIATGTVLVTAMTAVLATVAGPAVAAPAGRAAEGNTPPDVPTDLRQDGEACTTAMPYRYAGIGDHSGLRLTAKLTDVDGRDGLNADFQFRRLSLADEPAQERGAVKDGSANLTLPVGLLVDGETYIWRVRGDDGRARSAWTPWCYFVADTVAPATTPRVSSADYPAAGSAAEPRGGAGIPGRFTFDARGDRDIVGFRYEWSDERPASLPADVPGGTASVTLAPPRPGGNTLVVRGVDRAGNLSVAAFHTIDVRDVAPRISGAPTEAGVAGEVTFRPRIEGVVSYTYRVDDGPEQTLAAAADGSAVVAVTVHEGGAHVMTVVSRTTQGWELPARLHFHVDDSPAVSSADYPIGALSGGQGVPGTFRFQSRLRDTAAFEYILNGGPPQRIARPRTAPRR